MDPEKKLSALLTPEPQLENIQIKNHTLHFAVAGKGEPILLLHGATIGWGQWHANISELAKQYTVYALDLPGSGRSTPLDFFTADLEKDFVEAVEEFIQKKSLVRPHLIGHSFGAWIALRVAERGRIAVQTLTLANPVGFSDFMPLRYRPTSVKAFVKLLTKTALKPTRENMKKFLMSVLHGKKQLLPEFVDYFHGSIEKNPSSHPLNLIHRLSGLFRTKRELAVKEFLPRVQTKTLIIAGRNDPLVVYSKNADEFDRMPNAQTIVFEETGHVAPIERSAEFNEAVLKFLAS